MATYFSNLSNRFQLRLVVDVLSQDVNLIRSEVRRRLYLISGWEMSYTANRWLDVSGSRVYSDSSTVNTPGGDSSQLLHESIGYVTHGADGKMSLPLQAYFMTTGVTYYTPQTALQINALMDLPDIPRGSKIVTFDDFDINVTSIPFTLEKAVTSFSHKVYLQVFLADGTWSTLKSLDTSGTTGDFGSLSTTHQDLIYNMIPNSLSRPMRLLVDTFNGTTYVGRTTKEVKAIVPRSIAPTIGSLTIYDESPNARSIGAYIQGVSKLRTTISGAEGAKGSTVEEYEITQNGVTTPGATATMDRAISTSGLQDITGKVIDSRGRAGVKVNQINILPYEPPAISKIEVTRCNSDGTLNPVGSYAKVRVIGKVSSLKVGTAEKNWATLRLFSKLQTAGTYSARSTKSVSLDFDETTILSDFGIDSIYDIQATVTDATSTRPGTSVISRGRAPFVLGEDSAGFGIIPSEVYSAEIGSKGLSSLGDISIKGNKALTRDDVMFQTAQITSVSGQSYASVTIPYPPGGNASTHTAIAMAAGTLNGKGIIPYSIAHGASDMTITFATLNGTNFSAVATQTVNVVIVRR